MTREEREDHISDLCAFHNCNEKTRKLHLQQFVGGGPHPGGWHPHPMSDFKKWWEPSGYAPNGASVGGHPIAWRCWVKLETGERRWYGTKTEVAWNDEHWREEFRQWVKDGMDDRHHNWSSTTAPHDRMVAVLRECRETLNKGTIMQPVPKVPRTDYKPGQEPDSRHIQH